MRRHEGGGRKWKRRRGYEGSAWTAKQKKTRWPKTRVKTKKKRDSDPRRSARLETLELPPNPDPRSVLRLVLMFKLVARLRLTSGSRARSEPSDSCVRLRAGASSSRSTSWTRDNGNGRTVEDDKSSKSVALASEVMQKSCVFSNAKISKSDRYKGQPGLGEKQHLERPVIDSGTSSEETQWLQKAQLVSMPKLKQTWH